MKLGIRRRIRQYNVDNNLTIATLSTNKKFGKVVVQCVKEPQYRNYYKTYKEFKQLVKSDRKLNKKYSKM